uniref:Extracellular membrane protein CFEM domain-containing protein n=1 Tax=Bionectria ochroleuca TaxID=29856 RepID=A0A8H7KAA6_BIOOC
MSTADPFVQGDNVPECITSCLSKAVASVNCSSTQSCWCTGSNEQGIKDALTTCYKEKPSACPENLFDRMKATVDLICDQQAAANGTLSATSTSSVSAALPTGTGTLDSASSGSDSGLSKTAMIGMSVGLGVAGLIIFILLFLFIRERRRRKGMEFQEHSKRSMSKQSTLRPEHMSARDSVATKRTNTQSVDAQIWRPGRVYAGDSPPVPTPTIPTSTGTPVRDAHFQDSPQHTPRNATPQRETAQYNQRQNYQDRDNYTDPRLAYELPP